MAGHALPGPAWPLHSGLTASDVMLCHDSGDSHWSEYSHWQNVIGQTYASVMLVLPPMTLQPASMMIK